MLFWRAKAQKQTAQTAVQTEAVVPASEPAAAETQVKSEDVQATVAPPVADAASSSSNVVSIASARLADRLLEISGKSEGRGATAKTGTPDADEPIAPGDLNLLPGQGRALEALKTSIGEVRSGFNILILGPAGTGRRTAARRAAEARAKSLPQPKDWVYVASAVRPSHFEAFALPHGDGPRLVRDARSAVAKSAAMLDRIVASDDHRLSIDILEEDHRHRHEHALDALRRRAEAQNIALVKTPEGFVLAPMHEGKVVRSDIFRALPDGLQREVEAKIAALETELTNLVVELPSHEIATDDKHAALARETALRAIKPNLAITRKVFSSSETAGEILDLVEQSFVDRATARVRRQNLEPIETAWIHAVRNGSEDVGTSGAPIVLARDLSPEKLSGVIGHDADGRLSVRPGYLMRANGGFLIVEGWRLAANPSGWAALSTALESGVIAPETAPGLALEAEPLPLSLKVILIADDGDWRKLTALDPGITRHFPAVVRFAATAPDGEVSEGEYAALAAATAKAEGLRPLQADVAAEIYKDAKRRAGSADAISLDLVALSHILTEADMAAGADQSPRIRAVDVENASRRHQQTRTPAT